MTTKKPMARSTTTRKTPAKKVASPMKEPQARAEYTLQLGQGFQLLTRSASGGQVMASRVPAGARLTVSYWKSPTHPAHPEATVTRIVLHARIDGVAREPLEVARTDDAGQLLRLAPAFDLPSTAKLLEYWFELETSAGEPLWDSNWGNNHWLELTPALALPAAPAERRAEA